MSWKRCEMCLSEQQVRREGVISKLMLCLSCYEEEICELRNRFGRRNHRPYKIVVRIEEIGGDLIDGERTFPLNKDYVPHITTEDSFGYTFI